MKDTVKKLYSVLTPIYGEGEAKAMTRLIFHALKGWSATDMVIHSGDELSPYMRKQIDEILARLIANEPIQYVLGEAYFYGMDMKVGPGVLIPRPETEGLVEMIAKDYGDESDLKVADICTGSGCIAIALARNLKFPEITALDVSPKALEYAKENARIFKTHINFEEEDILNANSLKGAPYDIIVSNPPYIDESEKATMEPNVLDFEPHEALFVSDTDPLSFYRKIASLGKTGLKEGGRLYFEINPRHSADLVKMMRDLGYGDVEIVKDIHGKDRFLKCRNLND